MSLPSYRIRWINDVAVIGVGPNAAGAPVLPQSRLSDLCQGNRAVVLDLSHYSQVNSEFMAQLILAYRTASQSGSQFRICCPDEFARNMLATTQLDRLFPIVATLNEALSE